MSVAFQAGQLTGIDANVLLAIAKVESDYGRSRGGALAAHGAVHPVGA